MTQIARFFALLLIALSLSTHSLYAGEPELAVKLVIENHKFQPETISVPANKKVKLIIENRDTTPEEFESHSLNREKVIPGKSSVTIYVGPLKPGAYPFVGEFNQTTAKGVVVAK